MPSRVQSWHGMLLSGVFATSLVAFLAFASAASPAPVTIPSPAQTSALPAVGTPGLPPALQLEPQFDTVRSGGVMIASIAARTGSQPVDGVQVFLDFDPEHLQVVDAAGDPVSAIVPGSTFELTLQNAADNAAGRISFAAGQLTGSPISGSLTIASIHFRGLAPSAGTAVRFSSVSPRQTKLTFAGSNVLASTGDGYYAVSDSGSPSPTPSATIPIAATMTATPTTTATSVMLATATATPTPTASPSGTPPASATATPVLLYIHLPVVLAEWPPAHR